MLITAATFGSTATAETDDDPALSPHLTWSRHLLPQLRAGYCAAEIRKHQEVPALRVRHDAAAPAEDFRRAAKGPELSEPLLEVASSLRLLGVHSEVAALAVWPGRSRGLNSASRGRRAANQLGHLAAADTPRPVRLRPSVLPSSPFRGPGGPRML